MRWHSAGLKPGTVNAWLRRSLSAELIENLMGEPPRKRKLPGKREQLESEKDVLLDAATRGFRALLRGDVKFAARVGREFLHEMGEI